MPYSGSLPDFLKNESTIQYEDKIRKLETLPPMLTLELPERLDEIDKIKMGKTYRVSLNPGRCPVELYDDRSISLGQGVQIMISEDGVGNHAWLYAVKSPEQSKSQVGFWEKRSNYHIIPKSDVKFKNKKGSIPYSKEELAYMYPTLWIKL